MPLALEVPDITTFTGIPIALKVVSLHGTTLGWLVLLLYRTLLATPPTFSGMLIRMVIACP